MPYFFTRDRTVPSYSPLPSSGVIDAHVCLSTNWAASCAVISALMLTGPLGGRTPNALVACFTRQRFATVSVTVSNTIRPTNDSSPVVSSTFSWRSILWLPAPLTPGVALTQLSKHSPTTTASAVSKLTTTSLAIVLVLSGTLSKPSGWLPIWFQNRNCDGFVTSWDKSRPCMP